MMSHSLLLFVGGVTSYIVVGGGWLVFAEWKRGYDTAGEVETSYTSTDADFTIIMAAFWPIALAIIAAGLGGDLAEKTVIRLTSMINAAGKRSYQRKQAKWLARQPKDNGGPYRTMKE